MNYDHYKIDNSIAIIHPRLCQLCHMLATLRNIAEFDIRTYTFASNDPWFACWRCETEPHVRSPYWLMLHLNSGHVEDWTATEVGDFLVAAGLEAYSLSFQGEFHSIQTETNSE